MMAGKTSQARVCLAVTYTFNSIQFIYSDLQPEIVLFGIHFRVSVLREIEIGGTRHKGSVRAANTIQYNTN